MRGVRPEQADDMVTDTVANLHHRLTRVPFVGNFDAYSWVSFRNKYFARNRGPRKIRTVPYEPIVNGEGVEDPGELAIPDNRPGPEEQALDSMEVREFAHLYNQGFDELNSRYRASLTAEADGVTIEEESEASGKSENAITIRRHRARRALYKAAFGGDAAA